MATPCKFDIKASKKVGALTSALLTLLELHGQEGYALERAFYDGYNAVKEAHGRTQTALNAAVECCKVLEEIVRQGNAKTCLMAFADGMENGDKVVSVNPEDITVDTDLRYTAPKLCARVGKESARKRALATKLNKHGRMPTYKLNQCFGFNGQSWNFIEWWNTFGDLTKGILAVADRKKGYTLEDCFRFMDAYYDNYFVLQAKGKIVANNKTDRVVNV